MIWSYVFIDLDGTLLGEADWVSFIHNTKKLFTEKVIDVDVNKLRWSVLTARPKIDLPFIKAALWKWDLFPEEVITTNSWRYSFRDTESIALWKSSILRLHGFRHSISDVVYVDNDSALVSYMNSNDYRIMNTKALKEYCRCK